MQDVESNGEFVKPNVILIPKPRRILHPSVLIVSALFLAMGVGAIWVLWTRPDDTRFWIETAAIWGAAIASPVMAVSCIWRYCRNTQRARHSTARNDSKNSRLEELIANSWTSLVLPPPPRCIRKLIDGTTSRDGHGMHLVCFGEIPVSRPGDYRFEPIVISPTRASIGHFRTAAGGLIMGLIVLVLGQFLPIGRRATILLAIFAPVFALMIPAILWGYRVVCCPEYLRIAPGVVQIVRFRPWSTIPYIRTYASEPGTLVVLTHTIQEISVQLDNGYQQDRFDLSGVPDRESTLSQIATALVSTARTPELSADVLVG